MIVREVMTERVVICTPTTRLHEAAKLMLDHDCGILPVCTDRETRRVEGVITDRDIACRAVAQGKHSVDAVAADFMSKPVITAHPEDTIADCCRAMQEHQLRRIVIVDDAGACVGVISLADLVTRALGELSPERVVDVVRELSGRARTKRGVNVL